jgi:hypothetical protein
MATLGMTLSIQINDASSQQIAAREQMHNAHCWDQVGANTRYHRQMEKGRGCDEKPMPFPKRLKVSTVAKHDAGRDCEYDEVEPTD